MRPKMGFSVFFYRRELECFSATLAAPRVRAFWQHLAFSPFFSRIFFDGKRTLPNTHNIIMTQQPPSSPSHFNRLIVAWALILLSAHIGHHIETRLTAPVSKVRESVERARRALFHPLFDIEQPFSFLFCLGGAGQKEKATNASLRASIVSQSKL